MEPTGGNFMEPTGGNFMEPTGGTDILEACVGQSVVITEF
jgi:hypothetical protein